MSARAGDRGSATLYVVVLGLLVVLAGLVAGWYAAAVGVRHRATAAADLAALAAAGAAFEGGPPACAVAGRVALANGTRLVSCRLDGLVATVAVRAVAGGRARFAVTVRSRAGPAVEPGGYSTRSLRPITGRSVG